MSEEALQIADKRRDVKGKGETERYSHLNAELHRRTRRNKAFLSDQCHPQESKCKKAKWLSEEALKIAERRRKEKGR